jgi:DGQHR domain-containing protein
MAKTDPTVSSEGLHPLLIDPSAQKKEFNRRRDMFDHKACHPSEQQQWIADRWQIHREGKSKVQLKRIKPHDSMLEDQAWCLFYRMGYPELNAKRFRIKYRRRDNSTGEKQIDVFAKDDETVVVAECKSKEARGRRTLQKDLHETDSLQKALAVAVREHYGAAFKPKFIWLYITKNIIWSEPDVERAAAINVRIITENEMQYFDSFIRHMGPAGRYQFLAEFLEGHQIPGLSDHRIPATRGTLGGRRFYSFVSNPRHLLKIAFVNHQALNHPDGRPAYQRMVSPSRIKEIQKFIQNGGYFPTNILINFTEPCRFDLLPNKENSDPNTKFGWLYLPNKYKSAWIIDGQHRLYGYSHLAGRELDQPIAVIAFEKMNVKDEAELFVTINQKQKSVQRSVIVSLQADLKIDSSDVKERLGAVASTIAKQINIDPTSPLAHRFSIQGVIANDNQSLTIPELVNGLVRSGLLGRIVHGNHVPGPLSGSDR